MSSSEGIVTYTGSTYQVEPQVVLCTEYDPVHVANAGPILLLHSIAVGKGLAA